MPEGTILIGSTSLDTPSGYSPKVDFLKVSERTPFGTLIINRNTNTENQPISIYKFEISDVVNSKMNAIKAEVARVSNVYYVDNLPITERLSGDGTTKIFYTQRQLSGGTPVVYVGTTLQTLKTPPDEANTYTYTADVSGRAKFTFYTAPPNTVDNIIIQYIPKYIVNIADYIHTYRILDIAYYTLICEEVKP